MTTVPDERAAFLDELLACLARRRVLDLGLAQQVRRAFDTARRLPNLGPADVAGLGLYGVRLRVLGMDGAITAVSAHQNRLAAVALGLLVEPRLLVDAGFAATEPMPPRDAVLYADGRFGAWIRRATETDVSMAAPSSPRDQVVRGYLRLLLGEKPANRTRDAAQRRAVSRLLAARGRQVDEDEIDAALVEALDGDGKSRDGVVVLTTSGLRYSERRVRDVLDVDKFGGCGEALDGGGHESPAPGPSEAAEASEASAASDLLVRLRERHFGPAAAAVFDHLLTGKPLLVAGREHGVTRKAARVMHEKIVEDARRLARSA